MSDAAFIASAIAFFAILGTCSTVNDIERKVDMQRVQMESLLNECRAARVPVVVPEVEVEPEAPEDPCICPIGQVCMCQGTGETE